MIEEQVKKIIHELEGGNAYGEKVTLVAATKMQTADDVNVAIRSGICACGENKVQEFCDKYDLLLPCERHFIGHLQTNKVKYLIGKVDLYHSVDRMELATEIDKRSLAHNLISNVLIQINIGNEESKGGFALSEAVDAYEKIKRLPALNVQGFMAMLPISDDEKYLKDLCLQMRKLYDTIKSRDSGIKYLSMGMSDDYSLCVSCGSNMVRLGSCIFGKRSYQI